METQDQWALKLFSDVVIAALRVDHDGLCESASLNGEELATRFGDSHSVRRFRRNPLEWMLRRGRLVAAGDVALKLAVELERDLKRFVVRLVNNAEDERAVGEYRNLLQMFHKVMGRLADISAARGDDRNAFERYTRLPRYRPASCTSSATAWITQAGRTAGKWPWHCVRSTQRLLRKRLRRHSRSLPAVPGARSFQRSHSPGAVPGIS